MLKFQKRPFLIKISPNSGFYGGIYNKIHKVSEPIENKSIYKFDMDSRTEFSLFEACVMAIRGQWKSGRNDGYTINDEFFDGTKYADDDTIIFRFEYPKNKDFFKAIGEKYHEEMGYTAEDIKTASKGNTGAYTDSYFYDASSSDEDWNNGYIIRKFNEDNFNKLLQYLQLRNPIRYDEIKNLNREEQTEAFTESFPYGSKYEESMISDICQAYGSAMEDAYKEGYEKEIKEDYCELSEFNIDVINCLEDYSISAVDCLMLLRKHKDVFSTTTTFSDILKWAYEQKPNTYWDADLAQGIYDSFDEETFENSSFHKSVGKELDTQIDKIVDENPEDFAEMEDAMFELSKMGIELGEWTENNVTPDKKFRFNILSVDYLKKMFHVRLWDIEGRNNITGYMTPEGVKNLATVPTLFDAEQMLNEKMNFDDLPITDRFRLSTIEGLLCESQNKIVEYSEKWTPEDVFALRSQPGYRLPIKEAFEKFVTERLTHTLKFSNYKLYDYILEAHENDNVEYDWILKIYVRN